MIQDFFISIADRIREKYNIEGTLTREEIIEKLNTWEVSSEKKDTKGLLDTVLGNDNNIKIFVNKDAKTVSSFIANPSLIELIVPKAEKITIGAYEYQYAVYRQMKNVIKLDCSFVSGSFNALYELKKLTTLILRNASIPTLQFSHYIQGKIETSGHIYVPKTLIEDYKIATNWSVFADRFRAIEDYPEITGGALE